MKQFFGFTEDKVFGKIMSNKGYCKLILQSVLANFGIKIRKIEYLENQKTLANPDSSKDVRLDVLVRDAKGQLFNVEMQRANNHNLGERMRYYQSAIDRYALEEGKTYNEIQESFIIFLCTFDYFHQNKMLYSFHLYEDTNKDIILGNKSHQIVVNAFGSTENQSEDMLALTDLMNEKTITGNKNFKRIEKAIDRINKNPKERDAIVDYETKLRAEKQDSKQEGLEEGIQVGKQEGLEEGLKIAVTLNRLRNQGADVNTVKENIKIVAPSLSPEKVDELIKEYYK